ncbi:MAG: DNA modification methylase [Candidatus Omnitrophica bacterium]|nr:DNA modification methylase [Candidatus Omnitrophota bacterium]
MEIRKIPISQINIAKYNPRKDLQEHDPAYKRIENSIATYGLVDPLIWNQRSGNLVGGYQRIKILIKKGVKEVEVSVVDLDPEQEKALNLALNKVQGEWDYESLASLLQEMTSFPSFKIETTGFTSAELSSLLDMYVQPKREDNYDFNEAVKTISSPVTKRGDLILLGEHRLLCGDSANPEDIKLLMDGHKAQMWFTDPPFNCRYKNSRPTKRNRRNKPPKWEKIYKDDLPQAEYEKWLEQVLVNVNEYLIPGSPIYIWNGHRQFGPMYLMLLKHGFCVGSVIVWAKPEHFSISYADYNQQVEFCLYGWKKGQGRHFWYGPHNETTLWQVKRDPASSLIHPTQKPVCLSQRAIRNSSQRGDILIETFAGSGSTIIAAESLNRRCFACEISEAYCDAIVKRYIAYAPDKVSAEIKAKYLKEEAK